MTPICALRLCTPFWYIPSLRSLWLTCYDPEFIAQWSQIEMDLWSSDKESPSKHIESYTTTTNVVSRKVFFPLFKFFNSPYFILIDSICCSTHSWDLFRSCICISTEQICSLTSSLIDLMDRFLKKIVFESYQRFSSGFRSGLWLGLINHNSRVFEVKTIQRSSICMLDPFLSQIFCSLWLFWFC